MNPLIAFLQELYQRFIAKSPKFFVIWQWILGAITAVTGIPDLLVELGVTLPAPFNSIVMKAVAIATGAMFIMAKLPVQNTNETTTSGAPKMPITNPAKVASILLVLLCMSMFTSAQSMFAPIPKPQPPAPVNKFTHLTIMDTPVAGSNFQGFRFTGPSVLYAVNAQGQSTVFTFIGVNYENDYYDTAAKKDYTTWGIGGGLGEGGQIAPSTISAVTAAALWFNTQKIGNIELPFNLKIAAIYNFTTKTLMGGTGPGVSLNN